MIGRAVIELEPGEAAERQRVRQSLFKARIRQPVPLLQQQDLDHDQRRIGLAPFGCRMHHRHQLLDGAPVEHRRDAVEPRIAAQMRIEPTLDEILLSTRSMHPKPSPDSTQHIES